MKYTFLVFLILPMFIFSQKRYSSDQVQYEYPGEDYLFDDEWNEITGIVYQKYEIGHLRYEHEYKNASRDGLSKGWYVNGKLKYIENYQHDAYHGWVKKWPMDHSDSSLVFYEDDDVVNGTEKKWFHNKTLIEEINYKEGRYHGFYKKWHENGKQSYQCKYIQGSKSGEEIKWNEAGDVISKAIYKDGKLNGKFKRWSPNLKESCEVYYKDGTLWNGSLKDWYSNNQLQFENVFKEGKQDGKQTAF